MAWPNINREIAAAFEGGILPTMVFINRQNYERDTVHRPLHKHNSICELLLVCKGTGTYHVEEKTYLLEEGSIIFSNQGELHEIVSGMDKEIGSYCVGLTNLHKKGFPENFLSMPGEACVHQAGSLYPLLKNMFEQIYQLEDTTKEGKLAAQLLCASMTVIVGQLDMLSSVAPVKSEKEDMVLRIRQYLNQHYTEDITLDSIGKALGCSATYVSHVFKENTGRTPIQYVIRRRVGLAQNLLISTELTATQIAAMVGYDNTNYFCTLFAKVVGMTPIRYRTLYREESKGANLQD